MRRRGIYGSALIKKMPYFPKRFHEDVINEDFRSKNAGGVGYISGEWATTEFNVFVLKYSG